MTEQAIMNTYGKLSVSFESGDGCWLFDTDGNKYFDTFTGVAVSGLGHANPAIAKAIKDQASRLIHCSNVFHNPLQQELAETLCSLASMDKAFLCNSGAEANEAAIKIARKYGNERNIQTPTIITMKRAFHGRTMATISASANPKVQKGYEPLLAGFVQVELNDLNQLKGICNAREDLVAIMLEPIQGEAGVFQASEEYLNGVRELCDKHGLLMICDEIQSGCGRTGAFLSYQHSDITPDIVTIAKGLGNGFPVGACLARGAASQVLKPGSHGSTFGGNPLASKAALTVLEETQNNDLIKRAHVMGEHILSELQEALLGADYVADVRGRGLMIGIEMSDPCFALVPIAKEKGILLNVTADKVIRLLPPLTMSNEECEFLIDAVIQIIRLYAADDRATPRNS
jgi:acetylornithine/N-succinyldiaminopimelate aminotransferase